MLQKPIALQMNHYRDQPTDTKCLDKGAHNSEEDYAGMKLSQHSSNA